MLRTLAIALLLAGCGRINYDPLAASNDGGHDDGGRGDDGGEPPVDAAPTPTGLVFHFSFDGPLTADETGAHPANCTNCPTQVAGRVGQAANFDGSQCLFIPDAAELQPTAFTFAAWARQTDATGSGVIYGRPLNGATSNRNTRELYVRPTRTWNISYNGTNTNVAGPFPLGEWHHVAGSFDGSIMTAYVDGMTANSLGGGPANYTPEDDTLGCDFDMGSLNTFFVGDIDEVYLFNRALSADEVAALAGI